MADKVNEQNMSVSDATKAGLTLTLDGKEYTCKPLEQRHYGLFEKWVREGVIQLAKDTTKDMEQDERMEMVKYAFDKATKITIDHPDCVQAMGSYSGSIKLAQLMMSQSHPGITENEVAKIMADGEVHEQVMMAYNMLHGTPKEDGDPKKEEGGKGTTTETSPGS